MVINALFPFFSVCGLLLINTRVCTESICIKNFCTVGISCRRRTYILATGARCDDRTCPSYAFRTLVGQCSHRQSCQRKNSPLGDILCNQFQKITLSFSCISTKASFETCELQESLNDRTRFGFISNLRYPEKDTDKVCPVQISIPYSRSIRVVIYDFATQRLVYGRNSELRFTMTMRKTQSSCVPRNLRGVINVGMETNLPFVLNQRCYRSLRIEVLGNMSGVRFLMYYELLQAEQNKPISGKNADVLPNFTLISPCEPRRFTDPSLRKNESYFRILIPFQESTLNANPINNHTPYWRRTTMESIRSVKNQDAEKYNKILMTGVGVGVGISVGVILPLTFLCIMCYRRKRHGLKTSKKKSTTSKDLSKSVKNMHFHECTFFSDSSMESPVYATIKEEDVFLPGEITLESDIYCDVVDKLTDYPPPPPPKPSPEHFNNTSPTSAKSNGNPYTLVHTSSANSANFSKSEIRMVKCTAAHNVRVPTENTRTRAKNRAYQWCKQVSYTPRILRSLSEPCQTKEITVFAKVTPNNA